VPWLSASDSARCEAIQDAALAHRSLDIVLAHTTAAQLEAAGLFLVRGPGEVVAGGSQGADAHYHSGALVIRGKGRSLAQTSTDRITNRLKAGGHFWANFWAVLAIPKYHRSVKENATLQRLMCPQ
jgi:hypothetical protein